MAKLKIITGENNPILRAVSVPVKKFDAGLKKFAKELRQAMFEANGLGIAAPQVAKNIRVFIVILNYKTDNQLVLPMVNPEIISHGEAVTIAEEGCLSLPGIFGKVERYKTIKVEFFDLDGARHALKLSDLNARVVQHENDHLNGVLFIDKLNKNQEENLLI